MQLFAICKEIMPGFSMSIIPYNKLGEFQPYIGSEDNFQKAVARYLDAKGVLWFHCPNGGHRNVAEAAKLKAMGVKAGIPDILILEPRKFCYGFAIELKVGKNKCTDSQKEMQRHFIAANWHVLVSYSLDEVIFEIDKYLS
jgi:hypothetical protein